MHLVEYYQGDTIIHRLDPRLRIVVAFIVAVILAVSQRPLVAGLGLTGFALGFALRDTISNFLSGVLILLYKPFKVGEVINIAGFEGEVVFIDLRYTELKSGENKVLIPNSKLFVDPITVLKSKS